MSLFRKAILFALAAATLAIAGAIQFYPAEESSAAIIVVTNVDDVDNICNENCTLREAINAANSTPGSTITFNIPSCPAGCTIVLGGALPTVTANGTTIDGTSEPDFAGIPLIEIDGSFAGAMVTGLAVTGDNVTIKGLIINSFTAQGVRFTGSSGSVVQGNYIGTDKTGTLDEGNAFAGIQFSTSTDNLIGGDEASERNIIAGNNLQGIGITQTSNNNRITGNYIGTDAAGTISIPNAIGVNIQGSTGTEIGGSASGEGNVISGNFSSGVEAGFGAGNVTLKGNLIGTTANGMAELGNTGTGVSLSTDVDGNVIGGTEAGARNVISGNEGDGILTYGSNNVIQGNFIGTNVTGMAAIPNTQTGVEITFVGSNNLLGGTTEAARNVVSGNASNGINIGGSATFTTVQGNYVGVAADGVTPLGNGQRGLTFSSFTGGTAKIGGLAPGAGNLIAHNGSMGMIIAGNPGNPVAGNQVIGNGNAGVDIEGTVELRDNVISGNGEKLSRAGIDPAGRTAGVYIGPSSTGAVVVGNTIQQSTGNGIYVDGQEALIGGAGAADGNLIIDNGAAGIFVAESGDEKNEDAQGNTISANSIHGNAALGIDIHPQGHFDQDAGDQDQGANRRQNEPVLTSADTGSLLVMGSLNSNPDADFNVEFFSSAECDKSGYGEGEIYLATLQLHTDSNGNAPIDIELAMDVPSGQFITTTATHAVTGDTSEFSNCVEVDAPTPTPVPTGTPVPTPTTTPSATPTGTPSGETPTATPLSNGRWGDDDCNLVVDAVDALKNLRDVAALAYTQTEPCPDLGDTVPVAAAGANRVWGDVDCDGDVDAVDALAILRFVAALPVNQQPGCPAMGSDVNVQP